jgi:hypothetical protein
MGALGEVQDVFGLLLDYFGRTVNIPQDCQHVANMPCHLDTATCTICLNLSLNTVMFHQLLYSNKFVALLIARVHAASGVLV